MTSQSAGFVDLHTHSNFSDGSDSPSDLARKASEAGLRAIALTDHDNTLSYDEMSAACETHGIEHVGGVEVSLQDSEFLRAGDEGVAPINVHVLAYFVPTDPAHPFQRQLAELRGDRRARNLRLVDRLHDLGFTKITIEYLTQLAHSIDSVGRPHVARAMIDLHPELLEPITDATWGRVFNDFLGVGGRAYIPKTHVTIEQFVAAAAGSSTVFSIAHPLVNYKPGERGGIEAVMPGVFASLRERGLRGAETLYGASTPEERRLMTKLARDAGLIPTGGSDYHGTFKADISLGVGRFGDLRVPYDVLEELRSAQPT